MNRLIGHVFQRLPIRHRILVITCLIYIGICSGLLMIGAVYQSVSDETLALNALRDLAQQESIPRAVAEAYASSRSIVAVQITDGRPSYFPDIISLPVQESVDDLLSRSYTASSGDIQDYWFVTDQRDDAAWILLQRKSPGPLSLQVVIPVTAAFLGGLGAVTISAWLVGGLASRPLDRIKQFAEELSADTVSNQLDFVQRSPEGDSVRDELNAALKRIEAGYEAQARFLANVSHEVKTPISIVQAEADVILRGSPSEADFRGFVRSTSEEMKRLGQMIESFLLLTRVNQGKSQVRLKPVDMNFVLMDCIDQCRRMADQYEVHLSPRLYDGEASAEVEGSHSLLMTAIENLLRNAIRFSPKHSRVELAVARAIDPQSMMTVSVRDYGPGVPDALITKIFEPFTQASPERHRGRGTGLGLQIAMGIAEMHQGTIKVTNHEVGCEFTLTLPAVT